ncbi:MAG: hypothetical protein ACRDYW_11225, partial [Acidimicrobiales bacterium]
MSPPRLVVGDLIEVHTQYDDSWCAGFEIAAVLADGYRVRRTHDQVVLPEATSADDVRSARDAAPW